MNKTIIGAIVLLAVLAGGAYLVTRPRVSSPSSSQGTTTYQYLCDENKSIEAIVTESEAIPSATPGEPPTPTGSANVTLSDGRVLNLKQTISADGVRYANADESVVFWTKGNGALILEGNADQTYIGCVLIAPKPQNSNLDATYANPEEGFSLRLPSLQASTTSNAETYKLDESYAYQLAGGSRSIKGIKFSVPPRMSQGTNLSMDSYISVETLPGAINSCAAEQFLSDPTYIGTVPGRDNTSFSVASSTGAGAGNRYEETVYARHYGNGCIAVRYFIHYGVLENYPAGSTRAFEKEVLLHEFDQIRDTLVAI